MSQNEISFGEVTYREPERLRRPDRDRRWACLAYEVPGPIDLPIFLDRATADAIERHALRDTTVELGGILLGKECIDDQTALPFVWVTKCLEAKHYENTQASFTYTHDSWEEITRERDRLHPELDIVGWYHTHPDFGVFLSSHDLFIHRNFFAQPLQVAYVVDPIRQTRGFFQWRDGDLSEVGGFFLTADRGERVALSRLVNELESIPNLEGGGGALSPRLEAELIAMLTRPSHHQAHAADRTLSAAFFGMLGALLGVLGFAAVLWLNTLNGRVQEQTEVLKELDRSVRQTEAAQRLAYDALLTDSDKHGADKLTDLYEKAARERDSFHAQVRNQSVINDELATRVRELDSGNKALRKDLDSYKKTASEFEKDAKDAPDLRAQVKKLTEQSDDRIAKIQKLEAALDTTEGSNALILLSKYERTWWTAAAGWAVSLLLGLGLIAVITNQKTPDDTIPAPVPPPDQPPTHRIT